MRLPSRSVNLMLAGVFVASIIALLSSNAFMLIVAVVLFAYFIIVYALHVKAKTARPKLSPRPTKDQKVLQKIQKARKLEAKKKHDIIHNQLAHIESIWQLTDNQNKTFISFIEKKAYSDLYSKMTASLLPQLIKMCEACLAKNLKGCKRDVNRRINELVAIMKEEIKRKREQKEEDYDTSSKVYDHLIDELK